MIDTWYSEFLTIGLLYLCSVLSGFFFIFDILAYSWNDIMYAVQQEFYYKAMISDQYYLTSFERFIQQKVQKISMFRSLFSQHGNVTLSYSYLDWYNSCPCPLCVHFTPYRNCKDVIFVRWMECNTQLPEYVLSCVFRFFLSYFMIYFLYLFFIMKYLYDLFVLDLDSRTRSQP